MDNDSNFKINTKYIKSNNNKTILNFNFLFLFIIGLFSVSAGQKTKNEIKQTDHTKILINKLIFKKLHIKYGKPITNKINLTIILESTVIAPDGTTVNTFKGGKTATFTATQTGIYKINYKFTYSGKTYTHTREITCTN